MGNPLQTPRVYRFGAFELDARTGELFSQGQRTQLRDQPLQLLLALLANPGELVTREELTRKLWPDGTVVDFDRGLNKAVNKLRDALGDSADEPQFIEALPRKGYRFIGALNPHGSQQDSPEKLASLPVRTGEEFRWKWRYAALGLAVLLLILGVIASLKMARDHRASGNGLRPGHLEIDSVAVLPLENLSGDPEQAYFVDGMTDSLITEVARAGTLRVISRTTVLRYKGTRLTTKQIGRGIGCRRHC
jgi:DNA-binding winged helix-turn-helix (wHTH) protein